MAKDITQIIVSQLQAAMVADGQADAAVAPSTSLFELGLTSIRLAELTDELNEIFPDAVEVTDFFDLPDVQSLIQEVDRRMHETAVA